MKVHERDCYEYKTKILQKNKCSKNKEKCSIKIFKYFFNVDKCDIVSKISTQVSLWCNQNLIWINDL